MFELPDEGDTTGGPFPGPGPVSSFPDTSGFGSFVSGELFPGLESLPSTLPGIEISSNYYYFFLGKSLALRNKNFYDLEYFYIVVS